MLQAARIPVKGQDSKLATTSEEKLWALVLLIGATEERQVVLVDVLGDVEAVGLDQLLVLRQLVLEESRKNSFVVDTCLEKK